MNDKKSMSGITVHYEDGPSIPLEEFVAKEEAKRKKKEIEEERAGEKHSLYHKPQIVGKNDGKKVSYTRVYTRGEINKMTWKNQVENFVGKEDSVKSILAVLLSQEPKTVPQWVNEIFIHDPQEKIFSKRSIEAQVRYLLKKSPIKNLIVKDKNEKKVATYRLHNHAAELNVDDLFVLYYKRSDPQDLEEVFEKVPTIQVMMEIEDHMVDEEKIEDFTPELPEPHDNLPPIKERIGQVIGDALGLEISGSVDINININLNIKQ